MLQGWQSIGKCTEKVHFNIRYLKKFRPMNVKEDMEFMEARPILYLNMAAISSLFSSRNSTQNITKDGKVIQSPKVNRPKALCFDYLQLKEMFGLDLETEVITENSEDDSEI